MNDVQVFNHIGHSSDMVGMRVGSHEVIYSIIAEVFYICGDFGTAARISGVDKHCFIVRQFDKLTVALTHIDEVAPSVARRRAFSPFVPNLFVPAVPLTALFLLIICMVMSALMFL